MKLPRPIVWIAVLTASMFALLSCGPGDVREDRLSVVASIYPMGYFSERVGGELVTVDVLIGPGVEAHGFEPTASHLRAIDEADVVVMNGLELEPWLERALEALEDDDSRLVVEASDESRAIEGFVHEHGEAEAEDEEGHDEDEGEDDHGDSDEDEGHEGDEDADDQESEDEEHGEELDPHVWLDPSLALIQVERIRDALVEADPDNAAEYAANASAVAQELMGLDAEFEETLVNCRHDHFVTSHAAYAYLANRYGAEQIPITGLSPDVEPSPRQLAAIIDRVAELELGFILVEPVLSDGLAQSIARESEIEFLPIHAIGSVTEDELESHSDYFGLMRNNLASLTKALECT